MLEEAKKELQTQKDEYKKKLLFEQLCLIESLEAKLEEAKEELKKIELKEFKASDIHQGIAPNISVNYTPILK